MFPHINLMWPFTNFISFPLVRPSLITISLGKSFLLSNLFVNSHVSSQPSESQRWQF